MSDTLFKEGDYVVVKSFTRTLETSNDPWDVGIVAAEINAAGLILVTMNIGTYGFCRNYLCTVDELTPFDDDEYMPFEKFMAANKQSIETVIPTLGFTFLNYAITQYKIWKKELTKVPVKAPDLMATVNQERVTPTEYRFRVGDMVAYGGDEWEVSWVDDVDRRLKLRKPGHTMWVYSHYLKPINPEGVAGQEPAISKEPKPNGSGEDIVDIVKRDIDLRASEGLVKYGEKLKAFNGRSGLNDAYQEVIDLAVYLRQVIEERQELSRRLDLEISANPANLAFLLALRERLK
jgi:hypothetical protein